MTNNREEYLPHYRQDLIEKVGKVRKAMLSLHTYDIPDLNGISKEDFDLVKLAAINSIKGEIVAREERSRQLFVEESYLRPAKAQDLLSYEDTSTLSKCDFIGKFYEGKLFGLEVKGGEGNSVTLLERPEKSDIFIVWSHLDVMSNSPARNMSAVLARVVKQMINTDEKRQKVDFLVFYDGWYKNGIKIHGDGTTLPDVFVFPVSIPTRANPHPKLPNLKNSIFLKTLYKVVGGVELDAPALRHIWLCDIELIQRGGKWVRKMAVYNGFNNDITFTERGYSEAPCKPI